MTADPAQRYMYVPDHYRAPSSSELVRAFPFAQLISVDSQGFPFATAVPIYFESDAADEIRLIGHMARANPHAAVMGTDQPVLAIFAGPHAYISSSWYVERPTVPTWNYLTAQVRGHLTAIDDDAEQLAIMERTIAMSERYNGSNWKIADAPEGRVEFLLPMIRSFRIIIDRIDGATKLSQTHPAGDRVRIIEALERRGSHEDRAIAQYMRALDGL